MTQPLTQNLQLVLLKFQLHQPGNDWITALEIPYDAFPHYSSKPRAWLDYLGYALTGSDGVLSLSSETTDCRNACDLDLPVSPGEVYFFHTSGSVAFIDPHVVTTPSTHSSCSSFLDDDFRRTLIQRDGRCVFTLSKEDSCEASHLLYIRRLTQIRSGGQLDINSIDDPRNGLLIDVGTHARRKYGKVAFIPTPIRSLTSSDVAGAADTAPDSYRLTLHSFTKNARCWRLSVHGYEAQLRLPLPDNWPPEIIFTALYAGWAIKAWGPPGFAELLGKTTDNLYYPDGLYKRDADIGEEELRQRRKEAQDKRRTARREARRQRGELHETKFDAMDAILALWTLNNQPAWERAKEAAKVEAKQRSTEKVTEWLNGQ
ncbi:hypothetical protein WOLCODRAFT_154146 [Wolfiporia cocos MD-104 SS10]|uniref:HNH nuclease domain-containing protein n=1 Tax=Wolfiporia cocos (strain MD-104) TaxID=742152 RepID=A0A2H3JYX1_WOLCO|nr:hypothetical protein WOLCODRAFT_154146 [Wolfiporia cocos MD-104 SS10]